MRSLEAHEGLSFEDGYFTACYEVAIALPPPFDLQAALNWDRDQIMVRATQLVGEDQEQEVPPQDIAHPNQGVDLPVEAQPDDARKVVQDLPLT